VSLPDAVRSVLSQYANFAGRARRSEYWWYQLSVLVAVIVLAIVGSLIKFPFLAGLLVLAVLVPSLAVGVRRMHDAGRSGWWLLCPIVPIVFAVQDSQPGSNAFGASPKQEAVAA
jgi:uncharacterized membrane protein YhaH (DUF805 family)